MMERRIRGYRAGKHTRRRFAGIVARFSFFALNRLRFGRWGYKGEIVKVIYKSRARGAYMGESAKTMIGVHFADPAMGIDLAIAISRGVCPRVGATRHFGEGQNCLGGCVAAHSFDGTPGSGYAMPWGQRRRFAAHKCVYQ